LVAPVNTIRNWENEFDKWTQGMGTLIRVHNLADGGNRGRTIQRWAKQGGVLLTSDALFRNTVKKMEFEQYLRSPGPDVIILDEAHIMLKNKSNAVFKALNGVKTRRRICLTGSPFQNNLFEFFRMASYIRPGVLGNSEASFEKGYVNPIISGMSSDATGEAKRIADKKLNEIQELLLPFVQRKDASILLQDLRPMQQVVLHIRQTKVQSRLYSAYRRHQKSSDDRDSMNFLRMYSALRPVNNHPGCLLLREPKTGKENGKSGAFVGDATKPGDMTPPPARLALAGSGSNLSSSNSNEISKAESEANLMKVKQEIIAKEEIKENIKTECCVETKKVDAMKSPPDDVDVIDLLSDSEEEVGENALEDDPITGEWWSTVLQKTGIDKLSEIESGNKVLLLLHILTHADKLNEKVVLFSQCLKVSMHAVIFTSNKTSKSHEVMGYWCLLDSGFHFKCAFSR
jgi:SNF2 family DNA or RNA helicase